MHNNLFCFFVEHAKHEEPCKAQKDKPKWVPDRARWGWGVH